MIPPLSTENPVCPAMMFGIDPPPAERLRVLLIEDDAVDRMAFRRHVAAEKLAYDVTEVSSLREARKRLQEGRYDVLVLDNGLPDGSGFELFAEAGETPVVFVTGANDLALAVRAVRAGAADYVVKDTARSYLRMLPLTLMRAVQDRRTRELLRRSQQMCQQVFDEAPMGKILATGEGVVLRANRAAAELLGYAQSELTADGLGLVLGSAELAELRLRLQTIVSGQPGALRLERICHHRSGDELRVMFNVSVIRQAESAAPLCVIQLEDVTESRRLEQALRASEARLRHQLDAMPAAVFASDAEGLITNFNSQTEALWGRPPRLLDPADRFCGSCRIFDADGVPIPPERCWMAVALAERRVVRDEGMIIEFTEGNRRNVLAYSSPMLDDAGRQSGAINILLDVTHLKRLEQRQRTLETQLSQARKLEAIGTLAGGIAHEFNNLLTSILGNLQLAEMENAPGHPAMPYLQEAVGSSRRARDLVTRMLTFSRQAEGARSRVSLDRIVADAVPLLHPALPDGVELSLETEGKCPAVMGNAEEIANAVVQLGANAGRAMSGRAGVVTIALTHRVPATDLRDRHPQVGAHHTVCLEVRDTGVGMSPATLARLFEPFFTTHAPGAGAGLGLAGVFGVMKRHRGAIAIESVPGRGTSVRLFFPEANLPDDGAAARPPFG